MSENYQIKKSDKKKRLVFLSMIDKALFLMIVFKKQGWNRIYGIFYIILFFKNK